MFLKKGKREKKKSPSDVHGGDLEQKRGFKWRLKLQFSSHTISPCDNSEIAAGNNTMLQLKENPFFFSFLRKKAANVLFPWDSPFTCHWE